MVNYNIITAISADSVDRLRKCDVFRVMEAAANAGDMHGYAEWLAGERPDLAAEINECAQEIAQERTL